MSGEAGALPEYEVKALMASDHTAFQMRLSGSGRAGISRTSGDGLNTARLRFVIHAAGWLLSMVLHGRNAVVHCSK